MDPNIENLEIMAYQLRHFIAYNGKEIDYDVMALINHYQRLIETQLVNYYQNQEPYNRDHVAVIFKHFMDDKMDKILEENDIKVYTKVMQTLEKIDSK